MAELTYCGNNALYSGLQNNTHRIGTIYECLRKGIGTGYHSGIDLEYLNDYEPIDDTSVYCGTSETLPDGYDRFATTGDCLRKGVGVGKIQRINDEFNLSPFISNFYNNNKKEILLIGMSIFVILIILIIKPKFFIQKETIVQSNGEIAVKTKFRKVRLILIILLMVLVFYQLIFIEI
tara:strand:- start:262 stop:795 length:534 start_codon:yes stop_codon:yes gene_type:complete